MSDSKLLVSGREGLVDGEVDERWTGFRATGGGALDLFDVKDVVDIVLDGSSGTPGLVGRNVGCAPKEPADCEDMRPVEVCLLGGGGGGASFLFTCNCSSCRLI